MSLHPMKHARNTMSDGPDMYTLSEDESRAALRHSVRVLRRDHHFSRAKIVETLGISREQVDLYVDEYLLERPTPTPTSTVTSPSATPRRRRRTPGPSRRQEQRGNAHAPAEG